MRRFSSLLLILFLSVTPLSQVKAQTVELVAGNVLNGAIQGTLLGGASMALTNNTDFAYLRVGIGLGTLYGIGVAAYDLSYSGGREILVSGLFNDATNSSAIVLLDTFYGAALGSVIVTSVMLVANEPIVQGLQYGAGIGAWVGFGFGLFDAYALSQRSSSPLIPSASETTSASGLVGMSFDNGASLGFINPSLSRTLISSEQGPEVRIATKVELLNLRINF